MQKPYFGQNLTFQSAGVTLKIKSRSQKSTLSALCKFSQNPLTGSEDNLWKLTYTDSDIDAKGIRTKTNMSTYLPLGGGAHNQSPCIFMG